MSGKRQRTTFAKTQRERNRMDKAAEKRARRQARRQGEGEGDEETDQDIDQELNPAQHTQTKETAWPEVP